MFSNSSELFAVGTTSVAMNVTKNATTTLATVMVANKDVVEEMSTTNILSSTRLNHHDIVITNATVAAHDDYDSEDDSDSGTVGVAVGVSIALIILVALAILGIILLIRKKKLRKKADVKILENPQYGEDPDPVRRRSSTERTLSTLPTGMKFTSNNNSVSESGAPSTNGRKQKAPPPRPPIYRPPSSRRENMKKKPAPSPPQVAMSDLYEKDSPSVSTENLTYTAQNTNAEAVADDEPASNHLQPLLNDDGGSPNPTERKSPRKSPKKCIDEGRTYGALEDEKEDAADEPNTKKSLLLDKDKSSSHVSLDSYDRTKNPFFAD